MFIFLDGESENGDGGAASEAIENVDNGDSRSRGEETEGERRRDSARGEVELGSARTSEEHLRGESDLERTSANKRSHRE